MERGSRSATQGNAKRKERAAEESSYGANECVVVNDAARMSGDRGWMYTGFNKKTRAHSREWFVKTQEFLDHAAALLQIDNIRCPCNKCRNMTAYDKSQVTRHLCTHGFVPGYEVWYLHGESRLERATQMKVDGAEDDRMDQMHEDLQTKLDPDRQDPTTVQEDEKHQEGDKEYQDDETDHQEKDEPQDRASEGSSVPRQHRSRKSHDDDSSINPAIGSKHSSPGVSTATVAATP